MSANDWMILHIFQMDDGETSEEVPTSGCSALEVLSQFDAKGAQRKQSLAQRRACENLAGSVVPTAARALPGVASPDDRSERIAVIALKVRRN